MGYRFPSLCSADVLYFSVVHVIQMFVEFHFRSVHLIVLKFASKDKLYIKMEKIVMLSLERESVI